MVGRESFRKNVWPENIVVATKAGGGDWSLEVPVDSQGTSRAVESVLLA